MRFVTLNIVEVSQSSKIINIEKRIEISYCWKEFNGEIRNIFSRNFRDFGKIQETSATLRISESSVVLSFVLSLAFNYI